MNVVVIYGVLSSTSSVRSLPSGSTLVSLEVSVESADGRVSVPVSWFDPAVVPDWESGTEVLVRGHVRRRFFRTAAGTQSRTEVVAAEVIAAPTGRQMSAATQRAVRVLTADRAVSRGGGRPARSATSA
jgi:single-strand DNA-binding protein